MYYFYKKHDERFQSYFFLYNEVHNITTDIYQEGKHASTTYNATAYEHLHDLPFVNIHLKTNTMVHVLREQTCASFELVPLFQGSLQRIPINSWDALFCAHLMTNCSLQSSQTQANGYVNCVNNHRAQLLTRFSEVSLMWLLLKIPKLNIIFSNNTVLYTRAVLEFQVVNKQQTAFQFKVNINLIYLNLYRRRRSFVVCGPRA